MGSCPAIPLPSLRRLPIYYRRLRRAIDEGQGVISSQELGEAADVPAAQVGDNAGHTVVNERGRFALHLVPSASFTPRPTACWAPAPW